MLFSKAGWAGCFRSAGSDGSEGLGAALEALGKQGIAMIYDKVHQVLRCAEEHALLPPSLNDFAKPSVNVDACLFACLRVLLQCPECKTQQE